MARATVALSRPRYFARPWINTCADGHPERARAGKGPRHISGICFPPLPQGRWRANMRLATTGRQLDLLLTLAKTGFLLVGQPIKTVRATNTLFVLPGAHVLL